MYTHLPVLDSNNIWITVFSPRHYRIVQIQSDILVLLEASRDDLLGVASHGALVLNSVLTFQLSVWIIGFGLLYSLRAVLHIVQIRGYQDILVLSGTFSG